LKVLFAAPPRAPLSQDATQEELKDITLRSISDMFCTRCNSGRIERSCGARIAAARTY